MFGFLPASEGDVACSERLAAAPGRDLERLRFELRKLLFALLEGVSALHELAASQLGASLERAAFLKLVAQGRSPMSDRRQCGIEEQPDSDELLGRAPIQNREQRRPLCHQRQAGKERSRGRLLPGEAFATFGYLRANEPSVGVRGTDPRFGGFDGLRCSGSPGSETLRFVPGRVGDLLKLRHLCFGGARLSHRARHSNVERLALRLNRTARCGQCKQRESEDEAGSAVHPSTFAMIGMVRKD